MTTDDPKQKKKLKKQKIMKRRPQWFLNYLVIVLIFLNKIKVTPEKSNTEGFGRATNKKKQTKKNLAVIGTRKIREIKAITQNTHAQ